MARPPRAHPPAGLPPLLRLPRRRCTARPPDRLVGSPSQALIPVPPATRLCYSAWAPSTQAGPGGPGRFQAPGLLSLHPDPVLQAAPRPLPVRVPQALAAPGASVALPACPSFAPQSIDPLRASLHPLSGPSSPLRPIRAASGAPSPARQSVAHSVWYPRPWPSVSQLPPYPGRQKGLGAPSLSASPAAPSLHSPVHWLPSPSGLASTASTVCQADSGGRAPSVWLRCPGPGLLALGRASRPRPPPPSSSAIPARPFDIRGSAARPSPSVTSVTKARLVTPASCRPGSARFTPDWASWPRPPSPPARPRCGSTCQFGLRLYCAQSCQSQNSCSVPKV